MEKVTGDLLAVSDSQCQTHTVGILEIQQLAGKWCSFPDPHTCKHQVAWIAQCILHIPGHTQWGIIRSGHFPFKAYRFLGI